MVLPQLRVPPARCRAAMPTRAPRPPGRSNTTARAGPGTRPASPAPAATPRHARAESQPHSPGSPRRLTPGSWPHRPPAARSGHLCTGSPPLLNKRYADWMPGASRTNQSGACWRVRSVPVGLSGLRVL